MSVALCPMVTCSKSSDLPVFRFPRAANFQRHRMFAYDFRIDAELSSRFPETDGTHQPRPIDRAFADYNEAIRLNPWNESAYQDRANTLEIQERDSSA